MWIYNANSHIPFLSMGLSKMGKVTQSPEHEIPLLLYIQTSCKRKSIVISFCSINEKFMNIKTLTVRATIMFTINRLVESFKLPVASYSFITVIPAGLEVRICSTV